MGDRSRRALARRRLVRIALRESRTLLEFPRLLAAAPSLLRAPRGHGAPVLVVPGFGASDRSTLALRTFLRLLGYAVRGWGMGRNHGHVEDALPKLSALVERLAVEHGRPVRLVGWSLGGLLARETARARPAHVASVITLGTPVQGGPKYTAVAPYYVERGYDLDALEREIEAQGRTPIPVPITAIYSRRDAVVEWHACLDPWSPHTEHHEVGSTHLGLGISPAVLRIVAERLADVPCPPRPR